MDRETLIMLLLAAVLVAGKLYGLNIPWTGVLAPLWVPFCVGAVAIFFYR